MCGIAGILHADPRRPVDPLVPRDMADAMSHRGPEADRYFVKPGVGLAQRRLSIINLAGGDQSIGSEDGSVRVHPGVRATVDPAAVEDYLTFGMIPGGRSIFRGVRKLPPAHVLAVGRGRLDAAPRRYWQISFAPDESLTHLRERSLVVSHPVAPGAPFRGHAACG